MISMQNIERLMHKNLSIIIDELALLAIINEVKQ